jgi:DNA-directed RNA polymerase beta subunit
MSDPHLTMKRLAKKVQKVVSDPSKEIDDDDVWAAINSFFEENGLVQSQVGSYNNFIHHKSHHILDQFSHVTIEEDDKKYELELSNLTFVAPQFTETDDSSHILTPVEALWRNTTYFSQMFIDVTVTPPTGEPTFYEKIHLGNMPVMVRSDLCNITHFANDHARVASYGEDVLDHGGYFVIAPKSDSSSGVAQRRVLVPQERAAPNRVFVFYDRKKRPKYETYAEIRSNTSVHTTTLTVGYLAGKISCVLPWIDMYDIPLGVLFRALGVKDEREMAELCLTSLDDRDALEVLLPTLEYSYECDTQEAALYFIGRRGRKFNKPVVDDDVVDDVDEEEEDTDEDNTARSDAISYAKHLLAMELLPHCGQGEHTYLTKAKFLGYTTQKLLDVMLKRRDPESRDHYMNKRSINTGSLLAQQFYGALRRLVTEITNNTKNALRKGNTVNITSWIKPSIVTNAMQGAIANNAWNTGGDAAKGISQLYEQFNYTASIANLRKITTPMSAEGGKNIEPRDLHEGQWSVICLAETPEGKKTGLVKNLAMSSYITLGTDPAPIRDMVVSFISPQKQDTGQRIFLNGELIGQVNDPKGLVDTLVKARRGLKVSRETSIAYFEGKQEVQISTEEGRLCRPLLIVGDGKVLLKMDTIGKLKVGEMTWSQLMATGMVELIDKIEEETCLVAHYPSEVTKDSTHCELHPSLMLGIGGSIIPFPDHNQCIYQEEDVIMGDGSRKKIKDVRPGDMVKNFDPVTERVGVARVTHTLHKETDKQMYRLMLRNGAHITATYDHRFFGLRGWKMVDMLRPGDSISVLSTKGEIIYTSIDKRVPVSTRQIADITIDSPHQSFFCNGFGVHNSPRNTYQCIWCEEPVTMGDGSIKAIKDVKVGDEVMTFDPKTLHISKTKVVYQHTSPTTKRILKISTIAGKNITVTEDHLLLTIADGDDISIDGLGTWIEARDLRFGSWIYVYASFYGIYVTQIASIQTVPNVMISDITTESNNHSFIAANFCVHNSAMGKQAVGIPFTNYRQIMSGTFHTMMYVQKPLAMSRSASIIGFDQMPAGLNAMTAICPRPFNEEDSIEMNQDAIDAGFMNSFKWMCYYSEINEEKGEKFMVPEEGKCNKFKGNPATLGPEGFALPGTKLNTGDMIIGKVSTGKSDSQKPYTNSSVMYDQQWQGVVDMVQTGTTGDGYPYFRVTVSQLRVPIVGDKFCYTPDHDILTTDGWVSIKDVTMDHCIATLTKDGRLEYQKPTEVVSFDHDGDVIDVDTNQVKLTVTPEHKMYVKSRSGKEYKLVEAKELFDVHVHYKKDAEWEHPKLEYFTLPDYWIEAKNGRDVDIYFEKQLPIDPWLTFFGIWVAEGCVIHGNKMIAVSINKQRVKDVLYDALKEMKISYRITEDELLYINNRQLFYYLQPLSPGAINKYLPEWVWELSKEQCQALLYAMCLGDGHDNGNTPMYDTSSVKLKDDFVRLALHCGWAANAHIKSPKGTHKIIRGKDTVTQADAWRITVVKTQTRPAVNKHKKNQQNYVKYKGLVYCVTVPNHVIYVRSSGNCPNSYQIPVWSGNSFRHGQKGTIGFKPRSQDLPFNSQGISPDIVMNSLALPSRMTIAMIIEMVSGKAVLLTSPLHTVTLVEIGLGAKDSDGKVVEPVDDPKCKYQNKLSNTFTDAFSHPAHKSIVDATPFRKIFSIELIKDELRKYGSEYGDELLTDGVTGESLRALIFFGPAYSQRLKHMVIEKKHARAKGGRTTLVRQPMEGRAAGGGLRVGRNVPKCITNLRICY